MAQLTGSSTSSAATVSLSTVGTVDWIKWENVASVVRKSGGPNLISTYSLVPGTSANFYNNDPRTLTWTGGTPTPTGSSPNGVYGSPQSLGFGFTFTVPADTTLQQLVFYGGFFDGQGTVTATLSDGSAGPLVLPSISTAPNASGDINATVQFQAASAGQTLTIAFVLSAIAGGSGGANVTVCGAALSLLSTGCAFNPVGIRYITA